MKRFFIKNTSLLGLALVSASALFSCQPEEIQPSPELKATEVSNWTAKQFVDGRYIVVFKKDKRRTLDIMTALVAHGVIKPISEDNILDGGVQGFVGYLTDAQIAWLKKMAYVAYIEPDQQISSLDNFALPTTNTATTTTTTTTNRTNTTSQVVPAGVAMMGYADGTGKTAWIIDSGVDIKNTDLNVDLGRSRSFLGPNTTVQDGHGHGTAVAGIIGAKDNGYGLVGVAPNTSIVALRIMDHIGTGTASAALKALNHVSTFGQAGDVVSIGLATEPSPALDEAVKTVAAKGIFVAIAAGNKANDCSTTSPQRVEATNVYTVSAMDYRRNFWSNSSFGEPVDFCAPGVAITSLAIGGGTRTATGTTYAAPHVAGLLLLKGNNINNIGYVTDDTDGKPDMIPHL